MQPPAWEPLTGGWMVSSWQAEWEGSISKCSLFCTFLLNIPGQPLLRYGAKHPFLKVFLPMVQS